MDYSLSHLTAVVTHAFHSSALLLLGTATIIGYYCGGLARRITLPSIIGFMLLGVVLGPSGLELFTPGPGGNLEHFGFITEIALGFVAFTIGSELSLASLRRLGRGIMVIILTESLVAFGLVTLSVYLLSGSLPLALLFGAVAPASAPAGTVAVIQEYRARGPLTKALYAVVGFDDGLAIVIFGFAAALAQSLLLGELGLGGERSLWATLIPPLIEIIASIVVGTVIGLVFCQMAKRLRERRDTLILVFGTVLLASGLALQCHLSLILTNMVVGFVMVNTRSEATTHRIIAPLHDVMPLMFVLFFCLAGAHLDLGKLPCLGVLGLAYILARSAGLMGGAYGGALMGRMPTTIRRYLGLGILSQAGVAIGLSLIIQRDFARLAARPDVQAATAEAGLHWHAGTIAGAVITTITATCIVFEIVGPITTKIALRKAGEIPDTPERNQP